MSDSIIKVEGLGKKYIISHETRERYTALRDVISRRVGRIVAGSKKELPSREEFWALKDVSFEIKQGDAVGVIGRNGAGKSTLLKILSRITEPSHGRIGINGRIASLLEVGTGFHPELTGRENIFLNGAILGMTRVEIRAKFDEIVDFSGVEKFLDTPVKRYSSGMYVRLAFAVAAHLEPEILVVDEVLAVGDAEFQKKCLGKMGEVTKNQGRTVLFVSHNLTAVNSLCRTGLLLNKGTLLRSGDIGDVIAHYHSLSSRNSTQRMAWDDNKLPGSHWCKVKSVEIVNFNEAGVDITTDDPFEFQIDYITLHDESKVGITLILSDINDNIIFSSINNHEHRYYSKPMPPGKYVSRCKVPGKLLNAGTYSLTMIVFGSNFSEAVEFKNVLQFEVQDGPFVRGDYYGHYAGSIRPLLEWDTSKQDVDKPASSTGL